MYLGIDIGGTKTLLAVFDDNSPQILEEQKFETPKEYSELINTVSNHAKTLKNKNFSLIVAGVPGRLDRAKGIALAFGSLPWTNVAICSDLEKVLGAKVIIENDAKLAALSEAHLVQKQYSKVLYVTIGTGINSALVIDGKLDPDTIDSETGQMMLEHEGKMQNWEDFASGHAFAEMFGKKVKDVSDPGQLEIVAHNIALGLINLIPVLSPEVIIMGGGIGANLDKFHAQLDGELKKYENPMFTIPPILKAQAPEEAVIYGCWELARQIHGNNS